MHLIIKKKNLSWERLVYAHMLKRRTNKEEEDDDSDWRKDPLEEVGEIRSQLKRVFFSRFKEEQPLQR